MSSPSNYRSSGPLRPDRNRLVTAVLLLLAGLVAGGCRRSANSDAGGARGAGGGRPAAGSFAVPVVSGVVAAQDVPIYLDGLGTV